MQKSLHWIALGVVLVAGANSDAIASTVPRYRLSRPPVPLDSRADLAHQAPGFGHRVRFTASSSAFLPAAQFGTTYYDLQHNASTGRQVDESSGKLQTTWTKAPYPSSAIRTVNWARGIVTGSPQDFTLNDGRVVRYVNIAKSFESDQEFVAVRPGFTNSRFRPGGKAVVIYHDAPLQGGIQFNETQLDLSSGNGVFAGTPSVLPNPNFEELLDMPIWPKQAISVCGADMVHHTVGTWSGGSTEVWYWRGIINDGLGKISWSSMPGGLPVMIDPASAGISSVIEAQGDTVYIVMAKTVNSPLNADLVYYRSTNCGITWGNMVNVTGFTDEDTEGLLSEVGAILDEAGELHVIYNTTPASGTTAPANLYQWSPSTGIRMITEAAWLDRCAALWDPCLMFGMACLAQEQPVLTEPNLSVKPAGLHGIAEELLFAVWTQYGPSDSDCATIDEDGTLGGHLNGEIYMSISSDGGLTWDRPQNVTGSHTPGCLPGDCLSESWVSAAAQADSGLYLSYVEDRHAGAAVLGRGSWTENAYMLLAPETRLPVAEARISLAPVQFIDLNADPVSGTPQDVVVVVQNIGTSTLQFQVVVAPDESGPAYVTVNGGSSYSSSIPAGAASEQLLVEYHTSGLPDPSEHNWRLEVTSNDPENDPGQGGVAIDVSLQVFAASEWNSCTSDTISTLTHRLQISSCLELGDQGLTGAGFFNFGDSSEWLASGSPVVTLSMAGDSLAYDNTFLSPTERTRAANRSFRALSPLFVARDTQLTTGFTGAEHLMFADLAWGSATTTDSTIGLEYRFVLPRSAALSDGAYLTLAMHNRTGSPITGLSLGAIADFDVATLWGGGTKVDENQGVASEAQGVVAVRGGEVDTSGNFFPSTNYMGLFTLTPEGGCYHSGQGAGQILDNAFYLQPAGYFIPDSLRTLVDEFGNTDSWSAVPHIDTGQNYGDLSALLVYAYDTTLGDSDTLHWGFGIASSELSLDDLLLKIKDLRQSANSDSVVACCNIVVPGDLNVSGSVTSADIILEVNYCFKGGTAPLPCYVNGDVNCNGFVTSADIIRLVNYVFKSGEPPCDICNDSPVPCVP